MTPRTLPDEGKLCFRRAGPVGARRGHASPPPPERSSCLYHTSLSTSALVFTSTVADVTVEKLQRGIVYGGHW